MASGAVNFAKRDMTDAEFLEMCGNIIEWIGRRLMSAEAEVQRRASDAA